MSLSWSRVVALLALAAFCAAGSGAGANPIQERIQQLTNHLRFNSSAHGEGAQLPSQHHPVPHPPRQENLSPRTRVFGPKKQKLGKRRDGGNLDQNPTWLPVPTERTAGCAAAFVGPDCSGRRVLPYFGASMDAVASLTLNQQGAAEAAKRPVNPDPEARGWEPVEHNHPVIKDPGLLQSLPSLPINGHRRQAPFKSCALVGNSPALLMHRYGEEIDKHDMVMRCNNAPTTGFEKHVGAWTSVRFQNERWNGFRDANEPLMGGFCSTFSVAGILRCMSAKHVRNVLGEFKLEYTLAKKVHALNPAFLHWTEWPFKMNQTMPSTGIRALAAALHLCEHIDVYGLGGVGDWRGWYWDKYSGYGGKPNGSILRKQFPKLVKEKWTVDTWSYVGDEKTFSDGTNHKLTSMGFVEQRRKRDPLSWESRQRDGFMMDRNGERAVRAAPKDQQEGSRRLAQAENRRRRLLKLRPKRKIGLLLPAKAHDRGTEEGLLAALVEAGAITIKR